MKSSNPHRITVGKMAVYAAAAAALCLIAPFSFPLAGLVPISLASFAIYLFSLIFSQWDSLIIVLIYLAVGAIGLPVFSGMSGGIGMLWGATGGFLIGYLPLAFFSALFRRSRLAKILSMLLGTALLYIIGTVWYHFVTGNALIPSVMACVVPFLPGDFIKMALALGISEILERRGIGDLIRGI